MQPLITQPLGACTPLAHLARFNSAAHLRRTGSRQRCRRLISMASDGYLLNVSIFNNSHRSRIKEDTGQLSFACPRKLSRCMHATKPETHYLTGFGTEARSMLTLVTGYSQLMKNAFLHCLESRQKNTFESTQLTQVVHRL